MTIADDVPTDDTSTSEPGKFRERLEVVIAVLLGLAAIVTAWTAFQSSQLGDKVQESYSEGIKVSDQASQAWNTANATDNQDQALFLEFAKAAASDNTELATYIHDTLMSAELAAAVDWWSEQPDSANFDSPFVTENPNWSTEQITHAEELDAQAQQYFVDAKKADNDGDEFDLLTVIVTLALFLFGVASLVRQQKIVVGLAALGTAILVYSIIKMIVLGDPGGVF